NEISEYGRIKLLRGADPKKDQSYFLSAVPEEKFRNVIFPIGHMLKSDVKKTAHEAKLAVANKKESMGVCFVGKKKTFSEFLEQYLIGQPGDIKTLDGQHRGQHAYTIGQRARLHNGPSAWFVYKRNSKDNTLTVVPGSDNPMFLSNSLIAKDWVWSWSEPPLGIENGVELLGQIRYRQDPVLCKVQLRSDNKYFVEFKEPQWAIAPGQGVMPSVQPVADSLMMITVLTQGNRQLVTTPLLKIRE
ncbi:11673_t:CDS:10, partial [Diversispora eburnea]